MLTLSAQPTDGLPSRRTFLQIGGLGCTGLHLSTLLARAKTSKTSPATPSSGRAKSCILIFMDGGPSHIETWDVKPDAPVEIRGEFGTIPSSVSGIRVGELLPQLAKQMHHFAQVRSVHHTVTDHNAGSYFMLTGKSPLAGSKLILTDSATTFPPFGAVVSKVKPATNSVIPPYVLLPEYQWNNGVDIGGQKAGFLGSAHEPFVGGDPSLKGYCIPGLELDPDLPLDRLGERGSLLQQIDRRIGTLGESVAVERMNRFRKQAYEVITSPETRRAFDLSQEPEALRRRYGMDPGTDRSLEARKYGGLPHLGQCMLLARRLVGAGVRLITLMTGRRIDQAWDTHRDHFGLMRKSLCPPFDQALSTLIEDLSDRKMLDDTLVVVMGEFGRTPRIGQTTSNAGATKNGRDHWPYCYTVLFAGGGTPGGTILGASDKFGAAPKDSPATPADIAATIYSMLGIDPSTELRDSLDRPYPLCDGTPIRGLV